MKSFLQTNHENLNRYPSLLMGEGLPCGAVKHSPQGKGEAEQMSKGRESPGMLLSMPFEVFRISHSRIRV